MRGGWSGFGMATVGIHPNDFDLDPNKIPTGGVVQNCPNSNQSNQLIKTADQTSASPYSFAVFFMRGNNLLQQSNNALFQ